MKKIIFILFIAHYSLQIAEAQQPTLEWVRTYGHQDSLTDFLNDMVIDTNGNIYVTGRVATSMQNTDYATVKYNTSGVQLWAVNYNGIGTNSIDEAVALVVDKAGNVYVTGYSEARGFLSDTYVTIKYNTNGVQQWLARYDGGIQDDPTAIFVDDSGYVYVSGFSYKSGQSYDYLTIKYNNNGDSVWVKRYNGSLNEGDYVRDMTVDSFGNVYVTGDSQGDYLTIKYSPTGQELWTGRYSIGFDIARKIAVDNTGNVFVTGRAYQSNGDILTLKYDNNGNLLWNNRYNGIANSGDDAKDLKIDNQNNTYICGYSSNINFYTDYIVIKYQQNGDTAWVRKYDGPGHDADIANSLAIDNTGIYITGSSSNGLMKDADIATLKYSFDGLLNWTIRYDGTFNADDVPKKVKIDKTGSIFVSGNSQASLINNEYITIKYDQLLGINNISLNIPRLLKLASYPNPCNPESTLEYFIPEKDHYRMEIFDITGRKIESVFDEIKNIGTYKIKYKPNDLSSGVYFMRLASSKYNVTHKLILIK